MALLPSCFPVLHTFVLVQDCSGAGPSEVQLYTPLKDMKCLRSLRIDSECRRLDYDRLRQLFATFPLEDLYFWVANLPVDDLPCPRPIDAPQLQSLESKGSVVDMTALLSHLHAPALTAFEFEDGSFELTPDHMLHLCTVVSTRFPRTLKSLSLALQTPSKTELRVNAVVNLIRDILHPVLNMKQLERLSFVYLHYQVPITALMDEDIELLAQKLPNLRFLELFYDDDYIYDGWQPLTAMSLLYLAQRCPHLEELHIQVIETDLQDLVIPASAPTPANDHPLRMLAIRDLYFEDGLEENDGLKQLLDRVFPNLRATGPSPVLPKSLQVPELCSRYFVSESWERCEAAYPRNVFVCA
ncbi:hypothetical protein L227DRAFT_610922 [Lentinus tigrinus ALCF2SS1-6]|uniref:F-box domain-containing protein n=1 Tax=Lentinus tigrinus ALCF2SS1-6 TaxID=1328759 RepID=A0A5C2SAP6_9APHY|nr:hypothetical protein L227DRAFT_610922 [Lentinus tigrinus ALCF2SS1-6]